MRNAYDFILKIFIGYITKVFVQAKFYCLNGISSLIFNCLNVFFFSETLFFLFFWQKPVNKIFLSVLLLFCVSRLAGWLVNDGCLVLGWLIWAVLATLIIKHRHWNSHWRFHKFTDNVSFFFCRLDHIDFTLISWKRFWAAVIIFDLWGDIKCPSSPLSVHLFIVSFLKSAKKIL